MNRFFNLKLFILYIQFQLFFVCSTALLLLFFFYVNMQSTDKTIN